MQQPSVNTRRLTWGGSGYADAQTDTKQRSGFIKGPLPLPWMQIVMQLPGKALHVALAVWYLAGLNRRTDSLMLSPTVVRSFGVSRDAQYDALKRLEAAGLLAVCRQPGQAPRVTLANLDAGPPDCDGQSTASASKRCS